MNKTYPDCIIVDEQDNPIGQAQLFDAFKAGSMLRVARVLIVNSDGDLLLQQRGPDVIAPNLWDISAAGHVDVGESYESAAYREMSEEIGIEGIKLTQIDHYFQEEQEGPYFMRRFHMIFKGVFDDEVAIDGHEVSSVRWVSFDDLQAETEQNPAAFTLGFLEFFKRYRKYNIA